METPDVHSAQMRHAGRDLLSLGLMDARNRTLRWLSAVEESGGFAAPASPHVDPPLWLMGRIAWFQEHWIARNMQRQRGIDCDPTAARLASIVPDADRWYDGRQATRDERWQLDLPDLAGTRQYLADTMDLTLELLDSAGEDDAALYFFRLALFHEDLQGETLAEIAQALDLKLGDARDLLADIATVPPREPLLFPATRWPLGSSPGGFVFDNEKWAHEVEVPEFDIDAQAVTWAQYGEFVEDGGYDDPAWWSATGREWLLREERRVPRYVDQMRQGVLQQRFGRLTRVPLAQPAMHLSWHEAEAWCRWAGRRLPTEVEWEAAAQSYSRGFAWGGVWEWTGTTFRPYPGFRADPWVEYSQSAFGTHKVLRGGSFATSRRVRHPKFRRFARAERDEMFCGFRSCAV
jgi:gamma-glutamyl hercynylcysteine S-oxide synthase